MRVTSVVAVVSITVSAACSDRVAPTENNAPPSSDVAAAEVAAEVVVSVYPGQSIQAKVNSYPAGTTFLIKAGRHRRQTVIPKSGNVFLGEPGAILDGENAVDFAFHMGTSPYPSNVRIKGLIIERYSPRAQQGAIFAGRRSYRALTTGWVVEDCEIRYNATAGISLGNKMKVLRNHIHHNGQLGLGGFGDSVLVEGNEIAYNNYQKRFLYSWEAGGTKFSHTRWAVVRDNYVHHNWGSGLWADIHNIYMLYENNRVTDNAAQGIFHEISYAAVIRNNVVERNGFDRPWLYGAGIQVNHSPDVEVYGNVVSGNRNGIVGIQQNRTDHPSAYGPHHLKNLYVHDNIITMNSGRTGIATDTGDDAVYTTRNNRFQNNTYILGGNSKPFYWRNSNRTTPQWRSYGHDVNGTFR